MTFASKWHLDSGLKNRLLFLFREMCYPDNGILFPDFGWVIIPQPFYMWVGLDLLDSFNPSPSLRRWVHWMKTLLIKGLPWSFIKRLSLFSRIFLTRCLSEADLFLYTVRESGSGKDSCEAPFTFIASSRSILFRVGVSHCWILLFQSTWIHKPLSLSICAGGWFQDPCRYQNQWMFKSLCEMVYIVFVYNLCRSSNILWTTSRLFMIHNTM